MRRFLMMASCGLLAMSTMACGSGQKEVKSPDQAEYDAGASASAEAGVGGADSGSSADAGAATAASDASVPSQPPAPDVAPPSAQPPVIEVVLDGVTRPVQNGERLAVDCQRMVFLYSAAAAADCANVRVSGLVARPLAGLCQVGFLPLEQGFKPGQEADASMTVTGTGGVSTTRTFRVAALP